MPHSAASDLGLHCLPVTRLGLGVSIRQWVKWGLVDQNEEIWPRNVFSVLWVFIALKGSFLLESVCLGPVVQSIVSLTSLLVVKMLTALVSTVSNPQVFLLKKCE